MVGDCQHPFLLGGKVLSVLQAQSLSAVWWLPHEPAVCRGLSSQWVGGGALGGRTCSSGLLAGRVDRTQPDKHQ
jgi:hypothetical protein